MPLLSRRCSDCAHAYDVIEKAGVFIGVDRDDDQPICPKCGGAEFSNRITLGRGIELGDEGGVGKTYPYYDRGLGCWVSSAKHRKQICRERNLIPVEGHLDIEKEARRVEKWDEQDQAEAEYEQYLRDLEEHPGFAGFRNARDRGVFHDKWKPRKNDEYWRR